MKYIFLIGMFLFNRAEACESNAMKVYYIDLGKKFFVPPVPVEKHAEKVVNIKDCKLNEFFKAATTAETIGEANAQKARIKIMNGRGANAQTLYIDDSRQVQWSDKLVKVDEQQIEDIISLIKAKTAPKKKR